MLSQNRYAHIILPLALPGYFTYLIPAHPEFEVIPGVRVVVQVGRKLYTGLVRAVGVEPPADVEVKYIESVLDQDPIVGERHFQFWEWMASYYMCTIGEVMNSALPGSFKLEIESLYVLAGSSEVPELNDRERQLFESIAEAGSLSFTDLQRISGIKAIQPSLKSLIEKKLIVPEEELRHRYQPRLEDYILAGPLFSDEPGLHALMDHLEKRAPNQLKGLLSFYHLTGGNTLGHEGIRRSDLQKHAGIDSQVVLKLQEKGVFFIEKREVDRLIFEGEISKPADLSEAQANALDSIRQGWNERDVTLLHGVTASGKTEVYIHLISECINRGEQVLYLLPEIALTTQIIRRLQKHFGESVGVYHSRFSINERAEVWKRVQSTSGNTFKVILGARSALFLPFRKLGMIIADEEHETTFKQYDPAPRYHARDASIVLASMFGAKVLLGSATPALETTFNARSGKYNYVTLKERFGGATLPEVVLADIRIDQKNKTLQGVFTSVLADEMQQTILRGEQIILFQNRRGYSPFWQCHSCGWVPSCQRCDVSLTYHKAGNKLVCHYCGFETHPVGSCRDCQSRDIRMMGFGTEKIAEELDWVLPGVNVARLDLDTTRTKDGFARIIREFETGEASVLVGTQMVTKGLDFSNVGLVGILNADAMLKFPDFRSFERSFQLMSQVAGRAGRSEKKGKVVIQTFQPDHWVLEKVIQHDYEGLYDKELKERERFYYPPYFRLIRITLKHRKSDLADRSAMALAVLLRAKFGERILGPERPYISRINNVFLVQLLLKFERGISPVKVKDELARQIRSIYEQSDFSGLRIVVDVDPL
jgi:primosomal protein N' (replication factor Y)